MAITASNLTTNGSASSGTTYSTASITPITGALVLVSISSATFTPTVSIAGCNITWTQVDTVVNDQARLTVFRGLAVSPTTDTIDLTFSSSAERVTWSVDQFKSIDTSNAGAAAVVQSATDNSNNATTLTATLSAFGNINNATFGAIGTNGQSDLSAVTPGTGFTELADTVVGTTFKTGIETEFRNDNDTTVNGSWTGTNPRATIIGIEIKFGQPFMGAMI